MEIDDSIILLIDTGSEFCSPGVPSSVLLQCQLIPKEFSVSASLNSAEPPEPFAWYGQGEDCVYLTLSINVFNGLIRRRVVGSLGKSSEVIS